MSDPVSPLNDVKLNDFIRALMDIERKYAFERQGADKERKGKVKDLVIKYAKESLK